VKYTDTHGHAKSPHSATENTKSEDKHLTRKPERNKNASKTDRKRMVEKLKNVQNSGEK